MVLDRKSIFLLVGIAIILVAMHLLALPEILDAKFFYSGEQARTLLALFTDAQKQTYFINEILDLGLITSYTWLLVRLLHTIYQKPYSLKWLPMLVGLADLIETGSIMLILKGGLSPRILDFLGYVTATKWILGAVVGLILIAGLIRVKRSSN